MHRQSGKSAAAANKSTDHQLEDDGYYTVYPRLAECKTVAFDNRSACRASKGFEDPAPKNRNWQNE